MDKKIYNVLFVCTGNSARSIMAEVIMNQLGKDRFKAYSGGSHPRGEVHLMTLEVLASQGFDVSDLRSKSWNEFTEPNAPKMDFIMTVCDNAAGEVCPLWPGQPVTAHWGFADPAKVEGSHDKQLRAFSDVQLQLIRRMRLFMSLPIENIDSMSLQAKLREMGQGLA